MPAEEHDLMIKCANGSDRAFAELYRRHASLVYRFILSFVKSAELADDLRQEVFIKVWENRLVLADVKSFKSYLFSISKNHTLNVLKRASTNATAMAYVLNNYQEQHTPEDDLVSKEYLAYLNQVISEISPQSRAVFMLCRQQHKSYDEVAEILDISRNAVKKHMVKSMKILREAVKRDLDLPLSIALILLFKN
ncbi:RNA polymerase sigma-70 factor, ECF subfamily [Pedobacter westerhofensis]|uniref:RNA polymerase sigma-70 factor, ECF subfamily n=1 Tax=Pedobacter westerhofensis TaxID=425512 RepID=A0A521FU63_9SPHI|nr:RNA polymerase sigma-70 factor [Pedobacter westerhofensis]SMO99708.1 RNA polymerase sigma-70 factor, ECF subfamily [Pedobacter westerhofensis]